MVYSLAMDYPRRQQLAQERIAEAKLDLLLVTHLPNIRYLCGFTGSSGVLAIGEGKPRLFTDGRYRQQARAEVHGAKVVVGKDAALIAAAKWVQACGVHSIGVEAEHMTLGARASLEKLLSGSRLREVSGIVELLRATKDDDEIRLIRNAVNLGASLLKVALKAIRPGVSEQDVAAEIEYAARRRGAEAMSFETIVAAGPRSALPHGRATAARIPRRGFVVLDFGCILQGYCSDMTRTVGVGKMSAFDRGLYRAVRDAQQAATEAVRAGALCGEIDRAARLVLRKARLDRFFTHSTGHGVGLEIHESPRIARRQQEALRPGMVITIEPGVYVPGRGGVRIEDMVLVRERGGEVLTPAPKDWIEL